MSSHLPHVGPRDLPRTGRPLAPQVAPDVPPASLVPRCIAGALDLAVVMVGGMWFALLVGVDQQDPRLSTAQALLYGALAIAYQTAFEARLGWTPGKRVLGLRVVYGSGSRLTWGGSVRRNLTRPIDSLPWLAPYALGVLWCLATGTERRQRIGDIWAGTKVVRAADVPRG